MQSALKKINKIRLLDPPEERPENKIIEIHGTIIQNEGIKNDALKELEKNDRYYAGVIRMNYELIAENERLRKKYNKVVASYTRVYRKSNKQKKLIEKYREWRKKRNAKLKKWYKKRKNAKLKAMKVELKSLKKTNKKKKCLDKK